MRVRSWPAPAAIGLPPTRQLIARDDQVLGLIRDPAGADGSVAFIATDASPPLRLATAFTVLAQAM